VTQAPGKESELIKWSRVSGLEFRGSGFIFGLGFRPVLVRILYGFLA
jgi:hypothetical protein